MKCMRKVSPFLFASCLVLCVTCGGRAQESRGALQLTARITPTAARPEPIRQFTFYLLTKSYADIAKEVEGRDVVPPRDKFIDELKISAELKAWLKSHDVLDLTMPGLDQLVTPDDIIHVPEFLLAYQRSNGGGVTRGLPRAKFRETDKSEQPERYEARRQEYLAALKKFIQTHPETVSGMELQLEGVNPQEKWAKLQADHGKRVQRQAPEVAQTKYLAAKADTDLEGNASISGVPAGAYWISTLNVEASAGDRRLCWDVPVTIQAGQTLRIELTNLNAADAHGSTP